MVIEMTVMMYCHGPASMSFLEQILLGLEGNETHKSVTHHKEESKARMKIDSIASDKLRKYLVTSIAPFSVDGNPQEIVHIHSGKLSTKEVNVGLCKTVGGKQLQQFINDLPDGFYKPFTAAMLTIKKLKKSRKVNEVAVRDTSLIYSRVIALQLTNETLKVQNVLVLSFLQF